MGEFATLSYKERSALERLLKSPVSGRVMRRAQALLLLDEGETVQEVSSWLRVSRQTIYNWVARFHQRAESSVPERLDDAVRAGRPATAAGVIDPLIDAVIDSDPRDYNYNSTVWTAGLLLLYLRDFHQIEVSQRSVSYALSRLGLRWKHPRYTPRFRASYWRQSKGG
jgi:transposase